MTIRSANQLSPADSTYSSFSCVVALVVCADLIHVKNPLVHLPMKLIICLKNALFYFLKDCMKNQHLLIIFGVQFPEET